MYRNNLATLVEGLRPGHGRARRYAIVISFAELVHLDRLPAILSDFHRESGRLKRLLGSEPLQVSDTEFVGLSEQTEYSVLGVVPEIKMLLLKLVRAHAPEVFSSIDQSRFVRLFDLARQRLDVLELLQRLLQLPSAAPPGAAAARMLNPEDVAQILELIDGMSRQEFADGFVRSQAIAAVRPQHVPVVVLNEHFVSMSQLQRKLLPAVNLLLSRPLFNMLALELDQRMLDCLLRRALPVEQATYNLSVETIFTRRFEEVAGTGLLRRLVIEFRVSDIFESFERFILARDAVRGAGGRIAVDAILPAMIGPLRAARLGCEFAKIFCDHPLELDEPDIRDGITEMADSGTRIVCCRVESFDTLRMCSDLGVHVFQGFYIDSLLTDADERERFMVA